MASPVDPDQIEAAVLAVLAGRDPDATACPSEIARRLDADSWRDLMEPVRRVAATLVERGVVRVVQRGEPVDVRTARGPVRLRRGPRWGADGPNKPSEPNEPDGPNEPQQEWLLPIDPASHAEHQPADWRTRRDATAVWEAIGRSQPIQRWCLRTGYRTMQPGDRIWAYLSRRQEVCAVGTVREVAQEAAAWFVLIDWDDSATADLLREPLPRSAFGQVPMSVCRAGAHAATVLTARAAAARA